MDAHLSPAFGKDYRSKAEIISSLKGGADFILNDTSSPWFGKPINLPQIKEAGYTGVQVRYSKLRKAVVIKMKVLEP